ncbi:MAG: DNA repair protein RecN [Anaerolineales bacterium]
MLKELRIRDFAIINSLDLSLGPGLMVFTGETGAGKSIIIDAVELLIGGRAESTLVRSGAEMAMLEAVFGIDPAVRQRVQAILEREELLDPEEGGDLLVSREIRLEGRNICRVNGRIVPLSVLREIGDHLVDVHGQSEHLSLLRVSQHLHLLDRYAQVEEPLAEYRQTYRRLTEVRTELSKLRSAEQDAAQRIDFLTFQIEEIETAKLEPGEERELASEQARLANAEKLSNLSGAALASLEEGLRGEISASDLLGQAVEAIEELAEVDNSLEELRDQAQAVQEQVSDLARRLRIYQEHIEHNPVRLDEVEERLALIKGLKRKYGDDIESILSFAERARVELEGITHAEERIEQLEAEEPELLAALGGAGESLSEARRQAAAALAEAVEAQLADLQMMGARFSVHQVWQEEESGAPVNGRRVAFGPRGLDQVEFMVAPNPGEGLKPLVKIASGGETSRLMLALKGVLAQADDTPTLIFDEIDQGIGGRVGAVVGQKLWSLARNHQVLCITHLPQLAAFGDRHYKVVKQLRADRTETGVHHLEAETRTHELATMMGGDSDPNLTSAQALLDQAKSSKSQATAA